MKEFENSVCEWLIRSLAEPVNESVIAYCVNLYDSPFRAELVGSSRFDPRDEDWACEKVWSPSDRYLTLPVAFATRPWEERLNICVGVLQRFVSAETSAAKILRRADAVAVGFVDGNLTTVHQRVI